MNRPPPAIRPDTVISYSMTALFRYVSTPTATRPGYTAEMTKPPVPLRPAAAQSAGENLIRAAFATFAATCRNTFAGDEVEKRYPGDDAALMLVTRATVAPANTTTSGWASQLVQMAVGSFLADLGAMSAASRLMAMGMKPATIPLGAPSIAFQYPHRPAGPVARGWVAEGDPIPAAAANLEALTIVPGKIGAIMVASRELVRRSNAEMVFRQMLTEDAAISLDAVYFGSAAGSSTTSAGLLYNVSATPTTGDFRNDLQQLAEIVGAGGSGRVAFVTGPGRAAAVSVRNDINATILPSLAVADDTIIAVDPLAILHAYGPEPDIMASAEAALHMSDVPLPIVSTTPADPITSLYQADRVALRMLLDVGFVKRRATAVAYTSGIYTW